MSKLSLRKPLLVLAVLFVSLIVVLLCVSAYLFTSGVRVTYDSIQKHFVLDASKNKFVENLLLKFSKNLLVSDNRLSNPFGAIKNETSSSGGSSLASASGPYHMAPEVLGLFKDNPAGLYFFRIGWGLDKVSASDPWDYTKSAFTAEMVSYNQQTKQLVLKVTAPDSMPYIGQNITATEKCDPEKSYIEKGGKTTNPVNDITTYFSITQSLFVGQCASEKCAEIGSFCKVSVK